MMKMKALGSNCFNKLLLLVSVCSTVFLIFVAVFAFRFWWLPLEKGAPNLCRSAERVGGLDKVDKGDASTIEPLSPGSMQFQRLVNDFSGRNRFAGLQVAVQGARMKWSASSGRNSLDGRCQLRNWHQFPLAFLSYSQMAEALWLMIEAGEIEAGELLSERLHDRGFGDAKVQDLLELKIPWTQTRSDFQLQWAQWLGTVKFLPRQEFSVDSSGREYISNSLELNDLLALNLLLSTLGKESEQKIVDSSHWAQPMGKSFVGAGLRNQEIENKVFLSLLPKTARFGRSAIQNVEQFWSLFHGPRSSPWILDQMISFIDLEEPIQMQSGFRLYGIGAGMQSLGIASEQFWGNLSTIPGSESLLIYSPRREVAVAINSNVSQLSLGELVTEIFELIDLNEANLHKLKSKKQIDLSER